MSFQDLLQKSIEYFPDLKIKYKDQSRFMKFLGYLLFFNKNFMQNYTTTIGSTVYFPNEKFVKIRPVSAAVILLHELIHINDSKKITKPVFGFLYLFPQILALLCLPLMLLAWKIFLPLFILFALPLPAFFRMYYEKRAYLTSLYCLNAFGKRLSFPIDLDLSKEGFLSNFKDSSYYYMWIFNNLDKEFNNGVEKIKNNQRPFDDKVFDIIDDLVKKI